jgi:hypothetical protein
MMKIKPFQYAIAPGAARCSHEICALRKLRQLGSSAVKTVAIVKDDLGVGTDVHERLGEFPRLVQSIIGGDADLRRLQVRFFV